MPNDPDYSVAGYIIYNGSALTEASEISFKGVSNDKLVETLLKGAAGHSDGATKTDVRIKSAVPRAGLEADFVDVMLNKRTVHLRFRIANLLLTARGRITEWELASSVNNPNAFDVTFEGGKPEKQEVG